MLSLSFIHPHSLSKGQAWVCILTQISTMLGFQQLTHTVQLLLGLGLYQQVLPFSCAVGLKLTRRGRVCCLKSSVIYCLLSQLMIENIKPA